MNKKRLVALVLAFALVLSLTFALVACGDKGDGNPSRSGAYVLTDKATYLSYKNSGSGDKLPHLDILFEADNDLKNTYSLIAVDPNGEGFSTTQSLNTIGADSFIKWMSMVSTRETIAAYGIEQYGGALFYLLEGAQTYSGTIESISFANSGATNKTIRVSTTTSVNDSGLLGALEAIFESETGWNIEVASAGTGAAINAAKAGNADLLLVHSKSAEQTFIDEGYARTVTGLSGDADDAEYAARIPFIYNYFVLVGSKNDPADVKNASTIKDAFARIAQKSYFVSRGDASGTHNKEVTLWAADLNITGNIATLPDYDWYISAGQGMGACLLITEGYAV